MFFKTARELRINAYKIMRKLPESEKFNLTDQIRRASTSIVLNIFEGSSRKSKTERKRYYEMARGSVIEIDTCCDIIVEENYMSKEELNELGTKIKTTFILLSNLINSN